MTEVLELQRRLNSQAQQVFAEVGMWVGILNGQEEENETLKKKREREKSYSQTQWKKSRECLGKKSKEKRVSRSDQSY